MRGEVSHGHAEVTEVSVGHPGGETHGLQGQDLQEVTWVIGWGRGGARPKLPERVERRRGQGVGG